MRRLWPKVKCSDCRALLVGPAETANCMLLKLKANGGLVKPAQIVISVVTGA